MLLLCALIAGSGSVWADNTYVKVTSSSQVEVGSKIIFVCEGNNQAMTSSSGYPGADVTISESKIVLDASSSVCVMTVGGATDAYTFTFDTDKQLSWAKNTFQTNYSTNSANLWTIASDGSFTCNVTSSEKDSSSRKQVRHNVSGTTTNKFGCYTSSTGKAVCIYVEEVATPVTSIPTPELSVATGSEVVLGSTVTISNYDDNYVYYYTTDGTTPAYDETTLAGVGSTEEYNDGIVINGDITVKVIATDYTENSAVATYQYTFTRGSSVDPVGPMAGNGYILVTDASTLAAGDQIIIVGGSVAMSTTQNNNNRGVAAVTISENTIASISESVQVVTLEGSTGAWYFCVGSDAYIYAASNSSNQLKTDTKTKVGDNGKAAIEINSESGVATVTFQGSNSRKLLQYNSSSSIFSCYATDKPQQSIYIYRLNNAAETFDVTISAAGYKTLVSTVDFKTQEGTTAYIVTESTAEKATLTVVSEVPAGMPVILKGSGTVTLDVIENAAAVNGNLLQVSTESTGNGVYVLADKDGVGFYKWTGGSLGAGRVYLPAPAAAAREFLSFDFEETTGINNVESSKLDVEGFYNLAGQRVAQPIKGLYIVNGKKVIIK